MKDGIEHPSDADLLAKLRASTDARIGVGRAGPRPRTATLLRFQGDHADARDAIEREVDADLIERLGLFTVRSLAAGNRDRYLLRPDLGRHLDSASRELIRSRCQQGVDLQLFAGDGLSAAAVEMNLPVLLDAIARRAEQAGLSFGTPFFVRGARVGLLNEVGDLLKPDVAALLIGERPGLGRATSLSAYLAYRPRSGQTDAGRDVISNIFADGGLNPLHAANAIVELALEMRRVQASGVQLKLARGAGLSP